MPASVGHQITLRLLLLLSRHVDLDYSMTYHSAKPEPPSLSVTLRHKHFSASLESLSSVSVPEDRPRTTLTFVLSPRSILQPAFDRLTCFLTWLLMSER